MPFARPTLDDLRARSLAYVQAHLPGADVLLRRSPIRVFSENQAGLVNAQYGYLDWQINGALMPDTCEAPYLDRNASVVGLQRKPASFAVLSVTASGLNGVPIPAATVLATADGSVTGVTAAAATIANSAATLTVNVTTPGTVGNLAVGTVLVLQTAISGVTAQMIVASVTTQASDAETDAQFRARYLFRLRNPPQGGSAADYVAWATSVPGVTRAWCYPLARGAGTVDVVFVCDGRTNIIPLAADITAVQAAIAAARPVTSNSVNAYGPTAQPVAFATTGLTPNTGAVQGAIQTALAGLIATQAPAGAIYGYGVNASSPGGTLYLEQAYAAIANAAGVLKFDLASPSADVVAATGSILTLGAVTLN